jgi:hypothetical protein
MFWFQHPRPPSRKEVAEQVVMRKQAVPDVKLLIVETTRGKRPGTIGKQSPLTCDEADARSVDP